jgi:hypothetical protein
MNKANKNINKGATYLFQRLFELRHHSLLLMHKMEEYNLIHQIVHKESLSLALKQELIKEA